MKHTLHIVAAEDQQGNSACLYIGDDVTAARTALEQAAVTLESVRLISYPSHASCRYPAQEALDIKRRHDAAENTQTAALAKKRAEYALLDAKVSAHLEARHRLGNELVEQFGVEHPALKNVGAITISEVELEPAPSDPSEETAPPEKPATKAELKKAAKLKAAQDKASKSK